MASAYSYYFGITPFSRIQFPGTFVSSSFVTFWDLILHTKPAFSLLYPLSVKNSVYQVAQDKNISFLYPSKSQAQFAFKIYAESDHLSSYTSVAS